MRIVLGAVRAGEWRAWDGTPDEVHLCCRRPHLREIELLYQPPQSWGRAGVDGGVNVGFRPRSP